MGHIPAYLAYDIMNISWLTTTEDEDMGQKAGTLHTRQGFGGFQHYCFGAKILPILASCERNFGSLIDTFAFLSQPKLGIPLESRPSWSVHFEVIIVHEALQYKPSIFKPPSTQTVSVPLVQEAFPVSFPPITAKPQYPQPP